MQMQMKDSIVGAGVGNIYGPYLDGNAYVLSKVTGMRNQPDSVKARHILISTFDRNTQQPSIPDSVAKGRIDSIFNAIKGGASFATLAETISDDPGSAAKGGDLGYFSSGMMVKEFNDFCFEKSTGAIEVVKTQFGYHLIQIMDQKNFLPAYKIAYLSRNIDPSLETVNDAMNAANQFSGNSRTLKAFDENIVKDKYNKLLAVDIRSNDFNIQGLGVNRSIVRDIFSANVGDVLDPIEMSGQYVVIAITGEDESGMMSVAKARPQVESILRNEVRAEKIISKLGTITTLEALASSNNTVVAQADSVSFVSPVINGVGFEPSVGGFAFAKENNQKVSKPIAGNSGVFVIKTISVGAISNLSTGADDTRNNLLNQAKGSATGGSMAALRERAKIEDMRNKFL
jgi:peptidyl-prolyl cis-trans isomerase D